MSNRYGTEPVRKRGQPDVVEYIKDLSERLRASEVAYRIGHTSIEDGDLIVLNGDIRVKESDGTTVLVIFHGSTPEIRMYPLGDTDTHQVAFFGFDFDLGFGPDQALQISVEKLAGFVEDGGKLLLTRNYGILSHQPDGGQESYLWLNADPVLDEIMVFRGKMRDQWQYDTRQTFYAGAFTASSGFSTWTHTYASAFADQVVPIVNVLHAGSTISWTIESYSTSAFTVRFSSTTNSKVITFCNVRVS